MTYLLNLSSVYFIQLIVLDIRLDVTIILDLNR